MLFNDLFDFEPTKFRARRVSSHSETSSFHHWKLSEIQTGILTLY